MSKCTFYLLMASSRHPVWLEGQLTVCPKAGAPVFPFPAVCCTFLLLFTLDLGDLLSHGDWQRSQVTESRTRLSLWRTSCCPCSMSGICCMSACCCLRLQGDLGASGHGEHPLRGAGWASGAPFQPGEATLSHISLDPESGVTVLTQHCIQANDCLLARLISLSAAECEYRWPELAQRKAWLPFMPQVRSIQSLKACFSTGFSVQGKKVNAVSSEVWKLGPMFVIF